MSPGGGHSLEDRFANWHVGDDRRDTRKENEPRRIDNQALIGWRMIVSHGESFLLGNRAWAGVVLCRRSDLSLCL